MRELFQIGAFCKHLGRRFVEAEVVHRVNDLTFLDPEDAVAREARHQERFRIEPARVPEARHEQALVDLLHERFDAVCVAADEVVRAVAAD